MRVEVWVAAHHAEDEWWCVKATAGFAQWELFAPWTWQVALTVSFGRDTVR